MYVSDTVRLWEGERDESGYVFFVVLLLFPKGEVHQDAELRELWMQNKSFVIVLSTRIFNK